MKLMMCECEKSLLKCLQLNNKSKVSIFLLLYLTLFMEKVQKKYNMLPKKKSKDYALKIQKANKYLGYIAWAEIYLNDPEKIQLGIDVLEDLTQEYPQQPHAYLRLWACYRQLKNWPKALEIVEKLFIYGDELANLDFDGQTE